jgi:hypothetical protein
MLIICGGFGMLGIAQALRLLRALAVLGLGGPPRRAPSGDVADDLAPGLADQQGERTISLHRHGRVVHFGPNALGEKLAVLLR